MQREINTSYFSSSTQGKSFVVDLKSPHLVLSSSPCHGGIQKQISHLINFQSCEGKHHDLISKVTFQQKSEQEHFRIISDQLNLQFDKCTFMGTAANMNYCMLGVANFQDLKIHAFATAGVQANATRAGDPAKYYELDGKWIPTEEPKGTINVILHINHPMSEAALTRCVMVLTEAKSAVLTDLGVGSCSSEYLATGTGTDQFIIAAPIEKDKVAYTSPGAHTKLGECIGQAVYSAIKQALEWQNGLDVKRCRSLFHQLKRFGFKEDHWTSWLEKHIEEKETPFFEANRLSIEHDFHVSNCVAAICNLLDRQRSGHITYDSLIQQARYLCALMVVQLAHKDSKFETALEKLKDNKKPFDILAHAIVLAWREKWS